MRLKEGMALNVKRLASRIVQSPNVLHGQVVIEGTRVPVQIILGHLSAGDSAVWRVGGIRSECAPYCCNHKS